VLAAFALLSRGVDDVQKGPANLPNAQQVIDYLKQTINWHHQLTVEEQLATDPSDVLFLEDDRQIAKQVCSFRLILRALTRLLRLRR